MPIRPCLIIPIYNNDRTVRGVVDSLTHLDLPCLIVDDGSNAATRRVLEGISHDYPWVQVIRRSENGGKGAAMAVGFRTALERGFSHAVQLDADGQHDAGDVPRFLDAARRSPDALILGTPIFDDDAPRARRIGRWVTHVSVWVETLSFDIQDALYGFRCYPLEPVMQLYRTRDLGHGMVFDTEIAVRLHWRGVPMINIATRVHYARGGVSHFHYLRDNLQITRLHTGLIVERLLQIPTLMLSRTRA